MARGLGWEKYTAACNVLYDGKVMRWITGMTTRGTATASIPIAGEAGLHTIEVFGGQSGFPFLNKHETSWPWERVYRFAFTIPDSAVPSSEGLTMPVWALPPLLLGAAAVGCAVSRYRRNKARGETAG